MYVNTFVRTYVNQARLYYNDQSRGVSYTSMLLLNYFK